MTENNCLLILEAPADHSRDISEKLNTAHIPHKIESVPFYDYEGEYPKYCERLRVCVPEQYRESSLSLLEIADTTEAETPRIAAFDSYDTALDSLPTRICPKCGTRYEIDYRECPKCEGLRKKLLRSAVKCLKYAFGTRM